jgi:GxxExxY protein
MDIDHLTGRIIGCAIEVHRQIGPGLLESIYESALSVEFDIAGIRFERQIALPVEYRGRIIGEHRLDFIVERTVVVELKSVERMDPVFEAQVLTYLRLAKLKVGLLINFNSRLLHEGIKRLVV